jgi:outer membrane protein assembly factor BamB
VLRVLLTSTLVLACPALALEPLWTAPLAGMPFAPTLYPDATAPNSVVVAAGPEVVRIDGSGAVLWRAPLGADAIGSAAVADLDGNGTPDVVCATRDYRVVCLSGDGEHRWTQQLDGPFTGIMVPVIGDVVRERPGLEVVLGFDNGWMYCLAGNGDMLWRFFGEPSRVGPAALADIDGDGVPEIFYGTDDGTIYCLDGTGTLRWRVRAGGVYGRSGPNIADLDGDGRPELLITHSNVGTETRLLALDARSGAELWRAPTFMQGYLSNATVDLDQDGSLEILHGDKGNFIYCTNADGSERWRRELAGRGIFFAPAVADLDGDGTIEIAVGIRDAVGPDNTSVYILNSLGEIKAQLKTGSSANAAPAIADIDGDGGLELIVVSSGPNQVQAYSFGGRGPVLWPSLRGDSAMTGARFAGDAAVTAAARATAESTLANVRLEDPAAYWGENAAEIAWDGASAAPGYVEVCARVAEGITHTTISSFPAGASSVKARYWCSSDAPLTLDIRLFLEDAPGPVWTEGHTVDPQPADFCWMPAIESTVNQALAAGATCGADTLGLRRQLLALRAAQLEVAEAGVAPIDRGRHAMRLRAQAGALDARAQTLGARWRAGDPSSLLLWPDDNPWDHFGPDAVPDQERLAGALRIEAFQDEFENAALTLLNMSSRSVTVRCTFTQPEVGGRPGKDPELAQHITLRRAVLVPGQQREFVNDLLPAMDLSRTVLLPPGEAQQVWLVVDTHGLEPGTHELTLYVGSLEPVPEVVEVPVQIEVWPVALPKGVYAQMNWVGTDVRDVSEQQLRDMLDHGITVAYAPRLPSIPVDAEGALAGPIDWTQFDASLARLPEYFQLLFPSLPPLAWPQGTAPPKDSEPELAAFGLAVSVLRDHLRDQGWEVDRWAFYPYDEPWNTGFTLVPGLRDFCSRVKAVDPAVRTYTDPTGVMRIEYIEEFHDLIDVWQPEINHLKRNPELRGWFQENARTLWAYEATDPGKDLLPLGYYRALGWLGWALGTEGVGFWVYKQDELYWTSQQAHYSVVYATNDQVEPSRRWEACRDGNEDYRMLYAFRQAIDAARDAGRLAEAAEAESLLMEAVEHVVAWQIGDIDEITRTTRPYELDFQTLRDYRRRIAHAIAALR